MSIISGLLRYFQRHTPKPPEPAPQPTPIHALSSNPMPLMFVERWCQENGYSDLQGVDRVWWAIPPHGVIPVPIAPCTANDWQVWTCRLGVPENPERGHFWRNNSEHPYGAIGPGEYAVWNGEEWINIRQYFEEFKGW